MAGSGPHYKGHSSANGTIPWSRYYKQCPDLLRIQSKGFIVHEFERRWEVNGIGTLE